MTTAIEFLEARISYIDQALAEDSKEMSHLNQRQQVLIEDMAKAAETRRDLFKAVKTLKSSDEKNKASEVT